MLATAPPLRVAAASCRLQPVILNTYQSSSISTHRAQESKSTTSSTCIPTSKLSKPSTQLTSHRIRHASSLSEPQPAKLATSAESTDSTSSSSETPTTPSQITWNAFFALRKRRRWWQMGSSVASCAGATVGGIATLLRVDPSAFASVIPQIDPMFTMGGTTFVFGVVGWMIGPSVGTAIWKARNKAVVKEVQMKEKEFFAHIKRYRVDPTGSSVQNPVPDYYGEKIASVQDYRRWLKDQRAFNKKRLASIL